MIKLQCDALELCVDVLRVLPIFYVKIHHDDWWISSLLIVITVVPTASATTLSTSSHLFNIWWCTLLCGLLVLLVSCLVIIFSLWWCQVVWWQLLTTRYLLAPRRILPLSFKGFYSGFLSFISSICKSFVFLLLSCPFFVSFLPPTTPCSTPEIVHALEILAILTFL